MQPAPGAETQQLHGEWLDRFTQDYDSGGVHTAPAARLLMLYLAVALDAKMIIETGYDYGLTTEALALSGAEVMAVDNLEEYGGADEPARERLSNYPNVTLVKSSAVSFLQGIDDETVDLAFIDDGHHIEHMRREIAEAARILKPGGVVVFHDAWRFLALWSMVKKMVPVWEKMILPAVSPKDGINYGIGIVRKP